MDMLETKNGQEVSLLSAPLDSDPIADCLVPTLHPGPSVALPPSSVTTPTQAAAAAGPEETPYGFIRTVVLCRQHNPVRWS